MVHLASLNGAAVALYVNVFRSARAAWPMLSAQIIDGQSLTRSASEGLATSCHLRPARRSAVGTRHLNTFSTMAAVGMKENLGPAPATGGRHSTRILPPVRVKKKIPAAAFVRPV
jgi:hypothetical protein